MSGLDSLMLYLSTVAFIAALGAAWFFMGEVRTLRAERDRARLALARALRSWQYDANQGDGIDADLLPVFCRSCKELGITVSYPDGRDGRYELSPTLTDWLQAHDGRTVLPVLPPMEARDGTQGWG